jgi:hypothetical protein
VLVIYPSHHSAFFNPLPSYSLSSLSLKPLDLGGHHIFKTKSPLDLKNQERNRRVEIKAIPERHLPYLFPDQFAMPRRGSVF